MTAKPSRLPVKRILLAEDDESMRGFLERALTKAGYEVIAFANGKEAHERLQEEPFTLLLTDIVMPQMDGIELARRAAELDPELKIMFITGFAAVTLNTNSRAAEGRARAVQALPPEGPGARDRPPAGGLRPERRRRRHARLPPEMIADIGRANPRGAAP